MPSLLPRLAVACLLVPAALAATAADGSAAVGSVDLSRYVRVGRYDLPTPANSAAPTGSLLASEASGVTYDQDTGTLFVIGDGGTSVVQVSRSGALIDSMTLGPGSSPNGTEFYDTEGITYVGHGRFVLAEERDRQVSLFRYKPNTTLTRADVKTIKLGTTVGNIGIEGLTYDPLNPRSLVLVKEKSPEGIFSTTFNFDTLTASNGSPTTVDSTNLFDPSLIGTSDLSDVYALANLKSIKADERDRLLVISQEAGKVVEVDRKGKVTSTLTISGDLDNPLTVPEQTQEGVTMDLSGALYVVNEQGGGPNVPQLWVYAPTDAPNAPPTGVTLTNPVASLPEDTDTSSRVKVAGVHVADDGLGSNALSVTGPDAASFDVDSTGLYLKAGTKLDYEAKSHYDVSVAVDDPTVGSTPDATSAPYTLNVSDVDETTPPSVTVSEVAPWGSSNSTTYKADWFELTNTGSAPVDLSGWTIDDDSNTAASAVALNGVSTLAPGHSAVFLETSSPATVDAFTTSWFGSTPPSGLQIGTYSGSGVGLSSNGDAVNIFDASGSRLTGVAFDAATNKVSFDNAAGAGSTTLPLPKIATLSQPGVNGSFVSPQGETGSPGTTH